MVRESKVSFKHSEVLSYQSANGNIADRLPGKNGDGHWVSTIPGLTLSEPVRNAPPGYPGEIQGAPPLAE